MAVNRPDLDAVIERVQKMLNTQGRTPEEAAAYVSKAHAILEQYDLTVDDIGALKSDPRTAVNRSDAVATSVRGKPDGWKVDVLRYVAQSFDCRVLSGSEWEPASGKRKYGRWVHHYMLVGFKHDVDAARWAHSYLIDEITRLSKEYSKVHWDAIKELAAARGISNHAAESEYVWREGTHPLKAEIYFVKGAAQGVGYVLQQEYRARREAAVAVDPNALMVLKDAAIEEFIGIERHGSREAWEASKERQANLEAKWAHERELARAKEAEHLANETPTQRRKREAREQREYERDQRRWERQQYREQANMDYDALVAGQKAGQSIKWKEPVK